MRNMPWICVLVIAAIFFMAIFAPLLAPYSPIDQTLRDKLLPPFWMDGGSTKYILGTDAFGRDVFTRIAKCRRHYESNGLGAGFVDQFIR